jgi:hypothetical protein
MGARCQEEIKVRDAWRHLCFHRSMRASLLLVVGFVAVAAVGRADQAFFSADGKTVTFVPKIDVGYLLRLDLATMKQEKLKLGADCAKEEVTSLCRGGDGEALLTTAKGVYVHDAKGTRKLADAPVKAGWPIDSLAAAPASTADVGDWLFLSGSDPDDVQRRTFYSRKPGTKSFKPVFCRRVNRVDSGVFTTDGRFFFAGGGDLWEGMFQPFEGGDTMDAVLVGTRIAPLGLMNTDEANGGNLWVAQVMIAGKTLYVRLRGHGMSELVRVPMLTRPTQEMSTADNYNYQRDMLSKTEVINTGVDSEIWLSAATEVEGHEKLFFRASDGEGNIGLYLWDHTTGKSTKVAVEKEEG